MLIGESSGLDETECLEACRSDDNCLWFTHDSDGNVCLAFQDCDTLDASCDTCLSSEPQCSPYDDDIGNQGKTISKVFYTVERRWKQNRNQNFLEFTKVARYKLLSFVIE